MFKNKSGDLIKILLILSISLIAVQIAYAGAASSTTCGTVTGDLTLTADLVNDSTCFTVTTGFLTLNCNGHSITYNSNKNMSAYGINVTGVSSVIIQNCIINANVSNTNNTGGIILDNAQDAIVRLNTIRATGLVSSTDNNNYGIFATRGSSNEITQNIINITGKGNNNFGIYSLNEYDGNISANTFYVNGTQGNDGIHLSGSNTTDISGNTINARILNGTGNDGISLITSSFNYVSGNTITTGGTSSNEGINLFSNSNNNTVISNIISTNGSSNVNHGIDIDSSSSNLVTLNTVSTQGSRSNFGIEIADHSTLNIITTNTISTNSTSNSSGTSSNIGIGLETNVTYTNVSNNIITTRGPGHDNWGVELFALSAATVSNFNNIFNNIIVTNGTNTNHGINVLSSQHNQIFNNNVTTSGTGAKNYGIFISGSSINSSSNNISNNTIRTNSIYDSIGIHIMQSSWTNIYDNNITTASPTGSDNYGIFLNKTASNSTIFNNTVKTGGSFNNFGIYLINDSKNNKIESNIISTRGTNSSNFGIFIRQNSSNATIINNTITTFGTFDNFGIYLFTNVENTQITSNNIFSNGSTSENAGIFVRSASSNTTITNNTIATYGTFFGYGLWINESQPTYITHNSIRANGSQNYNVGIRLQAGNTTINSNSIITFGTDDNDGIDVLSGSSSTNITNNHINASGSTTVNAGVYVEADADDVNVINNTITAGTIAVSDTSYGVYAKSLRNNISYNRIIATGTTLNEGIGLFTGSSSNYVAHNTINATGSADGNVGIDFYSTETTKDNIIINNSIITGGTADNYGVWIETGASNNNITGLSITPAGTNSHGIFVDTGAGSQISNTTILVTNSLSSDIRIGGTEITTTGNNITLQRNNITLNFISTNGTTIKAILSSEAPSTGVPSSYSTINKYLNLTNTTGRSTLLLNISYKDSEVIGVTENTLGIFRHNSTNWTNSSFYLPLSYGVDTTNNYVYATIQNFSEYGIFGTNDSTSPQINTISTDKTGLDPGQNVVITSNITDNAGINNVQVNITLPNGTSEIYNMSNSGGIYSLTYNTTASSEAGNYTITITATDTAGNTNTASTSFIVTAPASSSSSPNNAGGGGGSGYVSNPNANPSVIQPEIESSAPQNTDAGQNTNSKTRQSSSEKGINITTSPGYPLESESKVTTQSPAKRAITSSEFNIFIILAIIAGLLVVSILTYQYIKRRRSSIW